MYKRFCVIFQAVICMIMTVSSCVNEEYDMSEGIDMEMTLLKNAVIPVGDVEKILIENMLTIDEDDEVITVDKDGNYSLNFAATGTNAEMQAPEVILKDITSEPVIVNMHTGRFAGLNFGTVSEVISYKEIHGSETSFSMDIEIDQDLPSQVKGIRKVLFTPVEEQLSMQFSIEDGTVYIAEGYEIVFSDHIHLAPLSTDDYTVAGSSITFNKDIKVTGGSPYKCSFHIDDFSFGNDEVVVSGNSARLVYTDNVAFRGEIFALTSDFTTVPKNLTFVVNAGIHDLSIESAELKVDFDVNIDDTSFGFSEMPEFLAGDDVCIDLYNPQLRFTIGNGTPAPFSISAHVSAYKDNNEVAALDLGPYDVNAESSSNVVITRRETGLDYARPDEDCIEYIVPELGDFFKSLPEIVTVSNVNLTTPDQYFKIAPGKVYDARFDYEFTAPLAFDKDLFLDFTQDIKDLNLNFNTGIKSASLGMVIVNSVPADFTISATGIDNDGNIIPDMTLTVDKVIAAGSHTSPTETSLTLTLKSASKTLELNGLRLDMKAKAGDSKYHGITLNKNQGLELKDIVLTLPDGITFTNDSEN